VILCNISDNKVPQAFTGLIAMNVAEQIGKPCLLLRYNKKRDDYEGSGRNIDNSYVENLKDFLQSTGKFEYVQGRHNGLYTPFLY
jgi:single-stranded-DNA-specific exonuclease